MVTDVRIGTGAFAYHEWKGKFYPKDLPASQAIPFYANTFCCVEINSTFYRMPTVSSAQGWIAGAPADFPVAVKVPQLITHIKRLKNIRARVKDLFRVLSTLGKHRGPALLQLPPNFKADLSRLEEFFNGVPRGFPVAVEFRHASWFTEETYTFLKKKKAALVHNDTDLKDMPFVSTARWGYIRLRRLKYSDNELKNWLKRIDKMKWARAFVIFKHEEKVTAPGLAKRFKAFADKR